MTNNNPFRNTRIEFHILQSFPVTCLNRDDVGSPKSAVVGGVTRARVSSQCWKRQVRLQLHEQGLHLGVRTKLLGQAILTACLADGAPEEAATACCNKIAEAFAKDTLYFYTDSEIRAFAEYAKGIEYDVEKVKDKDLHKLAKKVMQLGQDGLDVALFGRMVAQAPELNVEAACSFSHAITTHAVSNEVEFFTALDDMQTDPGAAHMDNLEYSSGTFYRYIALNLGQLWDSLNGQDMSKAVEAFTKALFLAIPAARQHTLSGSCPWDYAKVLVRRGQAIQLSFDAPVKAKDGYLEPSIVAMNDQLKQKQKDFGSLYGLIREFTFGGKDGESVDSLIGGLTKEVEAIHGAD